MSPRSSTWRRAPGNEPILLFDGVCNLCTGSVRFVIQRDPKKQFRFAPLQSATAEKLLNKESADRDRLESVILIDGDLVFRKSTAILMVARRLSGLWPLLSVFFIVPRPLRDALYDWVGRHRYGWFGKREECWLPGEDMKDRFLE